MFSFNSLGYRISPFLLLDYAGSARTFTPINLWDLRLKPDHPASLTLSPGLTAALSVLHGDIVVGGSDGAVEQELVLLTREGQKLEIGARQDATVLLLNGAPIDKPVAAQGPFVMNSQNEIQQAIEDYHQARLGQLAA